MWKSKKYKHYKQLENIEEDVEETKKIMYLNMDAIIERSENLDHLEDMAENLMKHAEAFEDSGKKIKFMMWLRDKKMTFGIVIVLLLVIGAFTALMLMKPWDIVSKAVHSWVDGKNQNQPPLPQPHTTPAS